MEAAAREQKLKEYAEEKELERKSTELSQHMANVLKEQEERLKRFRREEDYNDVTLTLSVVLFVIFSITVYIYSSTFEWANLFNYLGILILFSLVSIFIFTCVSFIISILNIKLTSKRILALATSILSPLFGKLWLPFI